MSRKTVIMDEPTANFIGNAALAATVQTMMAEASYCPDLDGRADAMSWLRSNAAKVRCYMTDAERAKFLGE